MSEILQLTVSDLADLTELQGALAEELGGALLDAGAAPVPARPERGDALQIAQLLLALPAASLAAVSLAQQPLVRAAFRRLQERLRGRGVRLRLPGQPSRRLEEVDASEVIDAAELIEDCSPVWDLFLAYSTPDRPRVEALHEALVAHSLRVFRDQTGVKPGQDWPFAILNAQRTARISVIALSDHWRGSLHLRDEIQRALGQRRAHDHGVIPVYLDGIPEDEDMPSGLKIIQGLDVPACGGIEAAAAWIAERVRER